MSTFINALIDKREIDKKIAKMHEKGMNLKPVLAVVGNLVVKSVKQNFREQGRPKKWDQQKYDPRPGRILIRTGALMKGIHYKVEGSGDAVTIL